MQIQSIPPAQGLSTKYSSTCCKPNIGSTFSLAVAKQMDLTLRLEFDLKYESRFYNRNYWQIQRGQFDNVFQIPLLPDSRPLNHRKFLLLLDQFLSTLSIFGCEKFIFTSASSSRRVSTPSDYVCFQPPATFKAIQQFQQ